jgi:hypothetical protein
MTKIVKCKIYYLFELKKENKLFMHYIRDVHNFLKFSYRVHKMQALWQVSKLHGSSTSINKLKPFLGYFFFSYNGVEDRIHDLLHITKTLSWVNFISNQ